MNKIPVATFQNRAQAEPLQQRLTSSGIHAEINDKLGLDRLWFVSRRDVGVRLEVPADEFERSEDLLIEWDQREGALREAVHCPECGSLRVEYPQATHKSILTNFFVGLAAELRLVEREYYCEDCHFTWPKAATGPQRVRHHMAPNYFIEGAAPRSHPSDDQSKRPAA